MPMPPNCCTSGRCPQFSGSLEAGRLGLHRAMATGSDAIKKRELVIVRQAGIVVV